MIFRTAVRDCLHLNWALPLDRLPPLPPPLAYDTVAWRGADHGFLSVMLLRVSGLHLQSLPAVRLSHPQLLARLCIVDGDGLPAFWLRTVLVPAWVLPPARLVARQPARCGRFRYPHGEPEALDGAWEVRRRGRLALFAEPGSPAAAEAPDLGSWERTVRYFLRRRQTYFSTSSGLRKISVPPRAAEPVPLRVELEESGLLNSCLGLPPAAEWPPLHSAWLLPEESFLFEVGAAREGALPRQVPAAG